MNPSPPTLRTTRTRLCLFWEKGTQLLKQPRASWEAQVGCTCSAPALFVWPGRHIMLEISGKIDREFLNEFHYYVLKLSIHFVIKGRKKQNKCFFNISLFLILLSRAVNNELIDTYQLKSLDGLVEARLEKIVIAQREEQGSRRSGGKNKKKTGRLYLTLNKYIQNRNERNDSFVTREELPGHHIDNFPMRKPYDRVIRCLGFRFNFSIFDRY